MNNKILSVVLIIEIIMYVMVKNPSDDSIKYQHSINSFIKNDINESKLENYIIGVVAAEMPASFSFEALKSQAVAARTFAYKKLLSNKFNYDNLNKDVGQGFITLDEMKEKWQGSFEKNYENIKNAVLSTKGEIIIHNNEPINAYYFSMSNGVTENSSQVFEEEDYLVSVDSAWDKDVGSYEVSLTFRFNEIKEKLNINCEKIVVDGIIISETNHVNEITVCGKKYSGIDFRKLLGLRSTDFDVVVNDKEVIITTRGYGHGVGMSQYGANSLANEGKTYQEIIKYYYKDVDIKKLV